MNLDATLAASTTIRSASSHLVANGKVLVLGQGTSSFLTVVRSLGRQGIKVHVGWCPPDCPALKSRYVARFHAIPPYTSDGEWKRRLIELMEQEHFDSGAADE